MTRRPDPSAARGFARVGAFQADPRWGTTPPDWRGPTECSLSGNERCGAYRIDRLRTRP